MTSVEQVLSIVNTIPCSDELSRGQLYTLLSDMGDSGTVDYEYNHNYLALIFPTVYHLEKQLSAPKPTDKLVLELLGFLHFYQSSTTQMRESLMNVDCLYFSEHYKRYLSFRRPLFFSIE